MNFLTIDNFATSEEIKNVNEAWPKSDWPGWVKYDPSIQCKQASMPRTKLPESAVKLLYKLATLPLPDWCESTLVPDLGLWGAGLHEMPTGNGLSRHIDAERHGLLGLSRVLSAVLYMHSRWESTWGGNLVLESIGAVEPVPGRLVLFDCRSVPHEVTPITCPQNKTRRSLALFWYGDVVDSCKSETADFDMYRN